MEQAKVQKGQQAKSEASVATSERGRAKVQEGVVVSNKMNKTIVVSIVRQVRHAKYGKFVKKTSKLYAHDEQNNCKIGDTVEVVESRPLSRLKRWKVSKVLTRAEE